MLHHLSNLYSYARIATQVAKNLPAWWQLDEHMPKVDRAYQKVREELREIGLLADDTYLDQVEVVVTMLPSDDAYQVGYAYVFDEGVTPWAALGGYRKGTIYLPSNLPGDVNVPGGTLINTIRHEYAHAWYALDPELFAEPWFGKAFGLEYTEYDTTPKDVWRAGLKRCRKYQRQLKACRNPRERDALKARQFRNDFVSEYAATLAKEDFAETFMTYLRYRNSLHRFKSRPSVWKKLRAVERAIGKINRHNFPVMQCA